MALASGSTPAVPPDLEDTYIPRAFVRSAHAVAGNPDLFYNYGVGDPCNTKPGVDFFQRRSGRGRGGSEHRPVSWLASRVFCGSGKPEPVFPGDGVEVDAGSKTLSELAAEGLHLAFSKHCLDLHGLAACPATLPAYSILVLKVTVPGHKQPVYVSIGLAGNGMVATDHLVLAAGGVMRTVTYPITMFIVAVLVVIGIGVGVLAGTTTPSHLARPVVTPALFLSLARSGIDGTFTAVYKLSAPTSSAESDATVTVAQRAASGTTAWPGGKPGEWSYRLTYSDGLSVEWLVRGNLLEDCWRVRKSKWRCSAGNYPGDVSIGYIIATIPYLPGMAFMSLEVMPPRALSSCPLRAIELRTLGVCAR